MRGVLETPYLELLRGYLAPGAGLSVHRFPDRAMVFWDSADERQPFSQRSVWVDHEYAELLVRCDGRHSGNDVVLATARDRGTPFIAEVGPGLTFLGDALRCGMIDMATRPRPGTVPVTGREDCHIPVHAMIELTDACNLRCAYCYCDGKAGTVAGLTTGEVLAVLGQLHDQGVHSVELTGGEPLLRQDFAEIFAFCCERFGLVGLLTNGMLLTPEIADLLASYPRRVFVGVSLDGPRAEIHDRLAGVEGAFARTLAGMRNLRKRGVPFRASMCVTQLNLLAVESTLELALELGARWFGYNLAFPVGRGEDLEWHLTAAQVERMVRLEKKLMREHPGVVTYYPEGEYRAIIDDGCGAGHKSCTVGPRGDLRPCVLLPAEYATFGNLTRMSLTEAFNSDVARWYRSLAHPTRERCGSCRYMATCEPCIARGILIGHKQNGGCAWMREQGVRVTASVAHPDASASASRVGSLGSGLSSKSNNRVETR